MLTHSHQKALETAVAIYILEDLTGRLKLLASTVVPMLMPTWRTRHTFLFDLVTEIGNKLHSGVCVRPCV